MSTFNEEQKSKLKIALDELVVRVEEKATEVVVDGAIEREELKPILDFMKFSIIQLMEHLGLFLADYIEDASTNYVKIGAKKISISITSLIMIFCFMLFGGIMLCFLAVGMALFIGNFLGKTYLGFFIVGLVVAIAAIGMYSMRNRIIKQPLEKAILKQWMD